MTPLAQPGLDELAAAACEGTLTSEQLSRLDVLLAADPLAVDQYCQYCEFDADLRHFWRSNEALEGTLAAIRPEAYVLRQAPGSRLRQLWDVNYRIFSNHAALSILVSGSLMTFVLLSLALWTVPNVRPGSVDGTTVKSIAAISNTGQAIWDASSTGSSTNRKLFAGDLLVLNSGLAEITYASGAFVVLQGPARFTLGDEENTNGCYLSFGELVARCESATSKGFVVQTRHARFVDIGTEFSVAVDQREQAEVIVLSGRVNAVGKQMNRRHLSAGQGAIVDAETGSITALKGLDERRLAELRGRRYSLPKTQAGHAALPDGFVHGPGAVPLAVANSSFEQDPVGATGGSISGWQVEEGHYWITHGDGLGDGHEVRTKFGDKFLTANRLAPEPDAPSNTTSSRASQAIDVSRYTAHVDRGGVSVELQFHFNSTDSRDTGQVVIECRDKNGNILASHVSGAFALSNTTWKKGDVAGPLPAGTRLLNVLLLAERSGAIGTNVQFDNVSARLLGVENDLH